MPTFDHDEIDPARAGGDIVLQICANHRDTVVHTMREILRAVAGRLVVRWTLDGFQSAKRGPTQRSNARNLFAFRDGTSNPDVTDPAEMNRVIWVQPGSEPAWTAGGTYLVARTIRMHVEFWDRVGMLEQEQMIGRYRVSGAPLGGTREFQNPDYPSDPKGKRIPLDAHIRLANPRTRDRRPADPSPGLQLPPRHRRGWRSRSGPPLPRLQPEPAASVRQDPDPPGGRADGRLHHPGRRRLFLPPAGAKGGSDWVGSGLAPA